MKKIIKTTCYTIILLGISIASIYYYQNMHNKTKTDLPDAQTFIDWRVKPQDNLYQFANGKWLKTTEIPKDKSIYGTIHILRDKNDEKLEQLIENLIKQPNTTQTFDIKNITKIYNSFLSLETLEHLKLAPLQNELTKINNIHHADALLDTMAHLHQIGVCVPFNLSVSQDMKQAEQYILGLYQSGLGLPDKDYYSDSKDNFLTIQKNYIQHITNILTLADIKNAELYAQQIFDIEKKLATGHWSRVDSRMPDKVYNKFEIAKLSSVTPHIQWANYLSAFNIKTHPGQSIIVYQPSALRNFDTLLTQIPLEHWKNYLRWHLLSAYSPYLHKAFVDENFKFYGTQLSGLKQNVSRKKRGLELVNGTLGDALGQEYVKKYFPLESKKEIDVLVNNLKHAFKLSLENNGWMSEPTKKAALLKLSKMTSKIGYPAKWKSYTGLILSEKTLVQNIMHSSLYEFNRDIQKLNKPVDKTEWHILPQTVNAYYSPNMNDIVFPAAILQAPLFDSQASNAQNYGAIGAIIGHEISHAFDDQGRKFDGDGNLHDWWTPTDLENFNRYTKNLIQQYGQYEPIKGSHLNGELTLGENIADISGLSIAYRAFKIAEKNTEKSHRITSYLTSKINSKNVNNNQLFFISWSQSWKNKIRDEELHRRLITDPHSPGAYRSDGVVKNIDAFYEAFNVNSTHKMYLPPSERVDLWSFGSAKPHA